MPVTVSYPGLYIDELPLSAHSITAAPTSVAVIVGYTHPFKTRTAKKAVRLFSFTDYEREFGGMFSSGLIENHVPQAVNQFFLNGGSDLYVVGLTPTLKNASGSVVTYDDASVQPVRTFPTSGGKKIVFRGKEPTDAVDMRVSLSNLRKSASGNVDTFDVSIVYGNRVETFRGRTLTNTAGHGLGELNGISTLVSIDDGSGTDAGDFGTAFPDMNKRDDALTKPDTAYQANFVAQNFVDAFATDGSLDKVPVFNLLLTPGIFDVTVNSAALAFAERKQAFAIIDAPQDAAADESDPSLTAVNNMTGVAPQSENGALYFPYLRGNDPILGRTVEIAPSGYVAGIFARTDARRGVWKAPAGIETTIVNTSGVVDRGDMNNQRQGVLYLSSPPINCIRSMAGAGTVVFGARTLVGSNTAYNQSKYVPVRRMTLFIEQTLLASLTWVVFEPNDEPMWIAVKSSIEAFMLSLFNQSALQGSSPSEAFQIKCDSTTTTQQDVDNGIVNIVVAFAPLKPAEFVVIKIAQLAGQAQA